jgi:type I restriction enzyme S subunit
MLTNLQKIGSIFNIQKGTVQSSKNIPGEFDFITASAEWKKHNEYSHECEALIFAMGASGSLGRTHYVNGKFVASDLCFVITPKEEFEKMVDLKFYHIFFNLIRDKIVRETATGTSKLAINQKKFADYKIHFPDISYQREIKNKFEYLNPKSQSLTLILSQTNEFISKLRATILQEAVQGKLVPHNPNDEPASTLLTKILKEKEGLINKGKAKKETQFPSITDDEIPYELPTGWQWVRVDDLGITLTGKTPPTGINAYYIGDIPFLNPANITDGKLTYEGKRISELGSKYSTLIPKNSILMVCINGSLENGIGRVAMTNKTVAFNQQINAIIPHENVYAEYILYAFQSPFFQKKVKEKATGTVNYIINKNTLRRLLFPLPPLAEQKRIVEKVKQLMSLCDELGKSVEQSKEDSELLIQSVLQEAFKEE